MNLDLSVERVLQRAEFEIRAVVDECVRDELHPKPADKVIVGVLRMVNVVVEKLITEL